MWMKVKSLDDLIDEFEVKINTELNDPIISETGEDILEEVEGDEERKSYIYLRIIQANQQTSSRVLMYSIVDKFISFF